jgi:hypothetical protein
VVIVGDLNEDRLAQARSFGGSVGCAGVKCRTST